MNKDDGGPAYPCEIEIHFGSGRTEIKREPGMSLRDAFAIAALQGILASYAGVEDFPYGSGSEEALAKRSYKFADAMLKEREK